MTRRKSKRRVKKHASQHPGINMPPTQARYFRVKNDSGHSHTSVTQSSLSLQVSTPLISPRYLDPRGSDLGMRSSRFTPVSPQRSKFSSRPISARLNTRWSAANFGMSGLLSESYFFRASSSFTDLISFICLNLASSFLSLSLSPRLVLFGGPFRGIVSIV